MKKFISLILVLVCVFGLVGCTTDATVFNYTSIKKTCEEERTIPRIDIDTNGVKIKSKEEYVDCTVSISGTEIENYEAGIRGRGNSTWMFPKKPYRIKFNEKVSVFGEEKNKSWVLLALYNDFSAVKDKLAFSIADAIGTDVFVPSYNYVELYLNGKYNGLYLMTDQVDENAGRTAVKEKFTAEDTAIPFLVELDAYAPEEGVEGIDWFSVGGLAYNIKYPEPDERYTQEQFDYIKQYITDVDNACKEGNLEVLAQLVDIDSFVDYYIVQEAMGQPEINWKSVYMYKSKDGLMKMGPIWDFDWGAMGPSLPPDRYASRNVFDEWRSSGNWFDCMIKNSPEFKVIVGMRFDEIKDVILDTVENTRDEYAVLKPYYDRNYIHWQFYDIGSTHKKQYDEVFDWVTKRIEWMDTVL